MLRTLKNYVGLQGTLAYKICIGGTKKYCYIFKDYDMAFNVQKYYVPVEMIIILPSKVQFDEIFKSVHYLINHGLNEDESKINKTKITSGP